MLLESGITKGSREDKDGLNLVQVARKTNVQRLRLCTNIINKSTSTQLYKLISFTATHLRIRELFRRTLTSRMRMVILLLSLITIATMSLLFLALVSISVPLATTFTRRSTSIRMLGQVFLREFYFYWGGGGGRRLDV